MLLNRISRKISRPDQGAFCFKQLMLTKQYFFPRFLLGMSLSGAATVLVFMTNLPGLWGVVLQELGRGAAAMPFGGISASLGVVAVEEILLAENIRQVLLRLVLLTPPQIALGLLWQRYRWIGGLAALAEHIAWNQWFSTPYWLIPTMGMATIYFVLFFHKEPL